MKEVASENERVDRSELKKLEDIEIIVIFEAYNCMDPSSRNDHCVSGLQLNLHNFVDKITQPRAHL